MDPVTTWEDSALTVAGDYLNAAQPEAKAGTIELPIRGDLPFRKLYVAAFMVSAPGVSGYWDCSSTLTFTLKFWNEGKVEEEVKWNWEMSAVKQWPVTAQDRSFISMRPQFRFLLRDSGTDLQSALGLPMIADGVEQSIKIAASGPRSMEQELHISCAPMRVCGKWDKITLEAYTEDSLTTDVVVMYVGCMSSNGQI